eukprot:scaffold5120_cov40-Cyclotella_meneghiniana.AAC.1
MGHGIHPIGRSLPSSVAPLPPWPAYLSVTSSSITPPLSQSVERGRISDAIQFLHPMKRNIDNVFVAFTPVAIILSVTSMASIDVYFWGGIVRY